MMFSRINQFILLEECLLSRINQSLFFEDCQFSRSNQSLMPIIIQKHEIRGDIRNLR